jgi:DNA-binding MarR family transcriptional regulator
MDNTRDTAPSDGPNIPAAGTPSDSDVQFDPETTLAPGERQAAREGQARGEAEAADSIRIRHEDDEQTRLVVRLTPKAKKAIERVSDAALGSKMGVIRTKLMEIMMTWVNDPSSAEVLREKLHAAGAKVDGPLSENVHVDMGFPRKLLFPLMDATGYLPLQGVGYPEVGRFFSALAGLAYAEGFEAPTEQEREEVIEAVQAIVAERGVVVPE